MGREESTPCIDQTPPRPPRERFPALAPIIDYLDTLTGRADLAILQNLLSESRITRDDVHACCVFGTRGYKRNTVSRSEQYELVALCWRSGDFTPIHDHHGSSCAFKVLEGTGTEIRFVRTPSGLICPTQTTPMPPGYVCAAQDDDIHQIANMQPPGQDLITLHIYSIPIKNMTTYEFATRISPDAADAYKQPVGIAART
ncbi:MAG: cysteine dioxygenase family protein [Phycisphaeraceae bacterium]|nr:cysteine dioxygenase family protein [Phycisphaerae bacterium]MBX3391878.1 cysteine dioxygenase family protein [Phycisphaeraceae bacterium]HRJ49490.1 cysteine dioxygenase family protein [Phycisphaerales bacterium]